MRFGLIGEKLGHSFSQKIHSLLGNDAYELKELSKEELPLFLAAKDFVGINVTIPYKESVIPFLDEVSPEVKAIGACNTILCRDGRLYGYNTDADGLAALIGRSGVSVRGRRCAILGTGGTSKTAFYVLSQLGAASIVKVSRRPKQGACTYEAMPQDIEILVNATPCGMYPHNEDSPLDLSAFPSLLAVFDVVYNPLTTSLVRQAKQRGLIAENGLYMLVAQAVKASGYFLGLRYPQDTLDRTYEALSKEMENIVLIGMPTSGKTTIGAALAAQLRRDFYDLDALIESKIGMDIPSYFARYGEDAFRDVEEEVIGECAKKNGIVIATGGGAILREGNVNRLKQNGKLYFLDRDLEKLQASSSRPLSRDREALRKRYEERHPRYLAVADVVIPANGTLGEVLRTLKEEIQ